MTFLAKKQYLVEWKGWKNDKISFTTSKNKEDCSQLTDEVEPICHVRPKNKRWGERYNRREVALDFGGFRNRSRILGLFINIEGIKVIEWINNNKTQLSLRTIRFGYYDTQTHPNKLQELKITSSLIRIFYESSSNSLGVVWLVYTPNLRLWLPQLMYQHRLQQDPHGLPICQKGLFLFVNTNFPLKKSSSRWPPTPLGISLIFSQTVPTPKIVLWFWI